MLSRIRNARTGRGLRHPAFLAAALAVVIVGGLLAIALRVTYQRELHDGQARAAIVAHLLEEETLRTFQAVDLVLQGTIDALRTSDLPENDQGFRDRLKRRLKNLPNVRALFVVGADGFITHDTDYPATPRISLADRPYFQVHQAGATDEIHIGTPLLSRSLGRWFVSVSRRIDGADGSFAGIAVAAVEPAYYDKFYTRLNLAATDTVALFHSDGTLIARVPESVGFVGTSLSSLPLFREHLPKNPRGTYASSSFVDGTTRIIGYRAVSGYPLVIATALSRDEMLRNWWRAATIAVASFALLAVLGLATTLVLVEWRLQRREAKKHALAMEKLQTIGRMTGGIAHDINNLIATLRAALMLVSKNAADPLKVRMFVAAADEAVSRGAGLASRLLAFAKRQQLEIAPTSVNELLRKLEPLLRQAASPNASIRLDLSSDIPPCLVDQVQFDAALLNLVINARDAMPDGGDIEIGTAQRTEPARSAKAPPSSYVCVRVRDTGSGMPESILEKIFEPFFTTKGERGTGLGLAQVHGVMRQIGGDVRVSSRLGAGTTIELLFPAAPACSSLGIDRSVRPGR